MRAFVSNQAIDRPLVSLVDLGAFLLFSLAFVLPSGYSYGAVLLLIAAGLTVHRISLDRLSWSAWFVVLSFLAYALLWGIDGLARGEGIRDLDRPIRFFLAALIFLALCRNRPSSLSIMAGIAFGSLGAGLLAAYEFYGLNIGRAHGFMPTNSFGMLTALYAGWGVLMLQTLRFKRRWRGLSALVMIGALSAGLATLLSGSRGAWLVLVALIVILTIWEFLQASRWLARILIVAAPAVLLMAAYVAPGVPVDSRVNAAYTSTVAYFADGERIGGSIPARLDMWSGGGKLFAEKPVLGWGEMGYQEGLTALFKSGDIEGDPLSRRHLHNQILHTAVTKGMLGLTILMGVIAAGFVYPQRTIRRSHADLEREEEGLVPDYRRFLLILVVAYLVGGLTRVPFEHHSGVMMFAFSLILFQGALHSSLHHTS